MATINYRGDYFTTAQVDTLTPGGTIEATDIFICTINGKSVSAVAGGTTVADVTAAVTSAWNASTIPEFMEITATDSTTHVTLTADTAGVPFTVTVSTTETGGGGADAQTFNQATTTSATGPTTLAAVNCEGGALPGNGDTFYIPPGRSILYGLTALSGVTLTNLYANGTYIGLPFWNVSGNGTYWEYRTTYLTLGATNVYVGHSEGSGVLRCKLNTGSVQTAVIVYDTGASADGNGFGAFQFKGTHASNTLQVKGGSATVAKVIGETATIVTLYVGSGDGSTTEPDVEIGAGTTLTTTYCNAGYLETWSAITTMNVAGGVHEHQAGAVTTANVSDGTLYYNSTGTLGTLNYSGGVVSTAKDQRAKTFTSVVITVPTDGATPAPYIRDPNGILTVTGYTYEPDGPLMQFDEQSVRRIVRTVLRTERLPHERIGRRRQRFTPLGDALPLVPCVNSSGITIPAYGLIKKSGVAPSGRVQCIRPDSTWGQYLVNGGASVAAGAEFLAYGTGQVSVLSITGNGSPSLGPVPNSFTARFGNPLIEYFGSSTSPVVGVLRPPAVLIGKPTANISLGSSGTMAVYDSTRIAISPQLTVAISYAYASLTTTAFMSAIYNAGAWYGAPLECVSGGTTAPSSDGLGFGEVASIESLGI